MDSGTRTQVRSESGSETPPSKPAVLIVEDEKGLADLYSAYLEDSYSVRTANTGEQALELLDDDLEVVLLDRRLDEWHGDELVTVIQDRGLSCQIAMVTAVDPDVDIINLPIDAYLTKSVSREELRDAVGELILRSEAPATEQELLKLISRKKALDQSKTAGAMESQSEYAKLQQRIGLAKDALSLRDADIGESTHKRRPSSCPNCSLNWDITVDAERGFVELASWVWKCVECGQVEGSLDPNHRRFT